MAVYADRVRENTLTAGTGNYSLGGAVAGFRTFGEGLATGSVVTYCVDNGTDWEIGEGTFSAGIPNTVSRTTILSSSNANAAVNWTSGTKVIYLTASANRLVTTDKANTLTGTLTLPSNGLVVGTNQLIVSGGKVGIGTSTLPFTLNLASGANTGWLDFISGGLALGSAGALALFTNNVERVRVNAAGDVGIGLSSPGAKLHVSSTGTIANLQSTSGESYLKLTAPSATGGYIGYGVSGTETMTFLTNNVERLRIAAAGNVGIGVSPGGSYRLHVSSTGSNQVASQGTTDASFITNVNGAQCLYLHSTSTMSEVNELRALPLLFTVNGAERARIDSNGNFGIGGAGVAYAGLTIRNTNNSLALGYATGGNGGYLDVSSNGAAGGFLWANHYYNSGDKASISGYSPSIELRMDSGVTKFMRSTLVAADAAISQTESMRIDASGNLLVGSDTARSSGATGSVSAFTVVRSSTNTPVDIVTYSSNTNHATTLILGKSASNTIGAYAGTASGQQLGSISFEGVSTGAARVQGAAVTAVQTAAAGATNNATALFFSTSDGSAAATERMRIDTSGNVGVGTTSMTDVVSISNNSANALGVYRKLDVTVSGSVGTVISLGALSGTTQTPAAQILGVLDNPATTGHIRFLTRSSSTMTERMRIDDSGNVSVGGVSPSNGRTLAVQNSGTGTASFYLQNSTTGYAANAGTTLQISSTDGYLWNYSNGGLIFGANNAERMRIDANGNVRIGVSSTTTQELSVRVADSAPTAKNLLSFGTTSYNQAQIESSGATINDGYLAFKTASGGALSERFRVDTGGNLLVTGVGGLGYGTGSGGTVTQGTNKSTAVVLNKASGAITMNNALLAANTTVTFTLTDSVIAATDVVKVVLKSGFATSGSYLVWAEAPTSGGCSICVRNMTAGSLSEALVLNYVVIKGATT